MPADFDRNVEESLVVQLVKIRQISERLSKPSHPLFLSGEFLVLLFRDKSTKKRLRRGETSHGICSWYASLYCRLTNHFCSFSLGKMNQNRPLCKNYRFAQIFASRGGSPTRNLAFALQKLLSRNPLYRPPKAVMAGRVYSTQTIFVAQMPTMQSECCPLNVILHQMWGDKPPRRKRGSQRRFGRSACDEKCLRILTAM